MNIQSASLYLYNRPLKQSNRQGLLIKVKQQTGEITWGEIAPLPGYSEETIEEVHAELLSHFRPLLLKEYESPFPSVRFGIEMALLNIHSEKFPINALLAGSPETMEKQAKLIQHKGYKSVKIKLGHFDFHESVSLIQSLLPYFKDMSIRLDMNRSWKVEDALIFAESFPEDTFEYFEEPLERFEDYAFFPFPIALDETLREKILPEIFSLDQLSALIIKPTLLGGPTELNSLLKESEKKGVDFILSSSYESELGIGLLAKLATHLKLPKVPMGFDTYQHFEDTLFEESIESHGGHLIFPKNWNMQPEKCQMIAHECF